MRSLAATLLAVVLLWPADSGAVPLRGTNVAAAEPGRAKASNPGRPKARASSAARRRKVRAAERWRPPVRAAARWARERQGVVSFAVRTRRGVTGRGLDRQFVSASVIKAMLMTTYLRSSSVRDRALTAGDRGLLEPMIRWSDNDAASAVHNTVGSEAVTALARAAGMTRFSMHPAWGLSLITARDQTRFFLSLERLLPERHRAYALGLLRTIVPEQRWGVAQAIPKGWELYFKGGWGVARVDHQVGLLRRGEDRVAIAVLTVGSPSHAYAAATLEGVSRRLVRGLAPQLRGIAGDGRGSLRPRRSAVATAPFSCSLSALNDAINRAPRCWMPAAKVERRRRA